MRGTVKWFNDAKGYGFIEVEGRVDVFVHYFGVAGDGFRKVNEGDEVEFEIEEGPEGPEGLEGPLAVNVRLVPRSTE